MSQVKLVALLTLAAAVLVTTGCNKPTQVQDPAVVAQNLERYRLEAAHTQRSPYRSPDEMNEIWRVRVVASEDAEIEDPFGWFAPGKIACDENGNILALLSGQDPGLSGDEYGNSDDDLESGNILLRLYYAQR